MIKGKNISFPVILDGGLSNVLESMGFDLDHKLWSARLIKSNPEAIIKAHLSYLEAGATCITSSGYQASIQGYMDLGENREDAIQLLLDSVSLAVKAKKQFLNSTGLKRKIYIAASLGPYGAYLANGAEYTGEYAVSAERLIKFHMERFHILEASEADFLACETIPSMMEVEVLSELLLSSAKPSWVSFSCKDETHLNDGHKIQDAAKILSDHPTVFAIGVNCTAPKYINKIIETLKAEAPDKRIIVYPNSGEVYHAKSRSWIGVSDPALFQKMAEEWLENGADIIGGCCRIGPDHILKIKDLKQ